MTTLDLENKFIPKHLQHINPAPVDTTAPLSWFAQAGYYVVDNKIFRHKIYAMQEATRKHLKPKDVIWVFNDNVYDSIDWRNPSNISLTELYRLRAQQLREKYNYLILSFSGGGDSTNILDSFILNNIHLDEVVVYWPRKRTANKYVPSVDTDPRNFSSEWDYLIEPKLKWLESAAPRTKITLLDLHDSFPTNDPANDIVEVTPKHNYIGYQRYKTVDKLLLNRQTTYKNYAFITGVNPPMLTRIKHHLMLYFSDVLTATHASDYTADGLYRNVEFFYWTPDMPEIVKAQAHALLNNLQMYPKYIDLLPEWHLGGSKQPAKDRKNINEQLRRWMKWVLYPTYNCQNLQVDKNTSPIYLTEWFSWFYNNPHSKEILEPHQSGIVSHQNLIDPNFFITRDGQVHDYYAYRSKLYHIGNLPKPESLA